jgi:thiol-disulfide isomerase/thioredoxin
VKHRVGALFLLVHALAGSAVARTELPALLSALELGGYAADEQPPLFVGRTAHGAALSLTDLRGKVVIVTFWATWCQTCRAELGLLEALSRELGTDRLAIVAVNVREPAPMVRDYAAALGLTFAVLVDPHGEIQRSYGVIGLPTTFLIGRDGRAVARAIGPRDWTGARSRELLTLLRGEP